MFKICDYILYKQTVDHNIMNQLPETEWNQLDFKLEARSNEQISLKQTFTTNWIGKMKRIL